MKDNQELNYDDLRYEKKFIITELDLAEIEHLIKLSPVIFHKIFYERRVNNIYMDSIDYDNYYENIAGISKRTKIRIRWYGDLFGGIKSPILEIKTKEGELGKKLSFPLKPFILDQNFSNDLLRRVFRKSDLPKWLEEKLKLYIPILLNSYKREYFVHFDKKHRITLDKDFIFFRIKNINNSFREKISDKETYIFELKYSFKDSRKAEQIIQHFPFRLTASSKYVFGMNLLEL